MPDKHCWPMHLPCKHGNRVRFPDSAPNLESIVVIIQWIYRDRIVKVHPVNVEFNKKNCENIEADIKRKLIVSPRLYDKYELYESLK